MCMVLSPHRLNAVVVLLDRGIYGLGVPEVTFSLYSAASGIGASERSMKNENFMDSRALQL